MYLYILVSLVLALIFAFSCQPRSDGILVYFMGLPFSSYCLR